jgi:hypothetical protein
MWRGGAMMRVAAVGIGLVVVLSTAGAAEVPPTPIPAHQPPVPLGGVAFTVIGQVTNTPPDLSVQYGYLPTITGLSDLFSSPIEDETTAHFTFYNDTTTVAVRHNGPMTIIEREGTTTVYYNEVPHGNFADSNSFRDGQPILVMDLEQQVIVDTVTGAFSVVIGNNVTAANPFPNGERQSVLGRRHDNFRWALQGHLNAPPPPNGYFAASIVKVQAD